MNKKYFIVNEEPNVNILGLDPIIKAFHSQEFKKIAGKSFSSTFYEVKNNKMRFGAIEKEWNEFADVLFKKIKKDIKFEKEITEQIVSRGQEIFKLCKKSLLSLKKNEISDVQKKEIVENIFNQFIGICVYGLIAPIIEVGGGKVSKELDRILRSKAGSKAGEYQGLLSFRYYESFDQVVFKRLAEIGQEMFEDKKTKKIILNSDIDRIKKSLDEKYQEDIEKFLFECSWINYSYQGPETTFEQVIDELKIMLSQKISPKKQAQKIEYERMVNLRKQNEVVKKIKLDKKELYLIKIVQNFTYTKYVRAKMMFLADYTINKLLESFASKKKTTVKKLGFCTMKEILYCFKTGKLPSRIELNQRLKYCLLLSTQHKEKVYTGEKAKEWIKNNIKIINKPLNVSEISGQVACSAKKTIRGKVKIINVSQDMSKFHQGEILVSIGTTPEILPAMKKSAAIITDMGGITCHAAIVSRELKIPCIIGTKIATAVLKDGDVVEVDANKGIVKIL